MKILLIAVLSFFSSIAFSRQEVGSRWTYRTGKDCKKSDAKVEITVGVEQIDPRLIYVRQGDNVCMIVTSDDTRVSLTIDKHPVQVTVQRNQSEMVYFKVPKVGEFNLVCHGCADGRNFPGAKIIVQPTADFDKYQEDQYRKDSERYRREVGPRPSQRTDKYER